MSEALIRAQIKTILQAVTGIGAVHDYERYSRSIITEFRSLMTASGIVNGWVIHRESSSAEQVIMGPKGQIERVHTFRIAGIYALDDANGSEKTFQAILDAIFAAFKSNGTLNGTAISHRQMQIDSVTVTKLGDDLYHTAELTLEVMERTAIT